MQFIHWFFVLLLDENRVDGVRRDKVLPAGRGGGGGVGRGGSIGGGVGRGRGVDFPNKEKRRDPADRRDCFH